MSGFVGVRNREAPVTDELLARLWQPIAHRGPDADGRWVEGTLGVAAGVLRVTPESAEEEQPYRHRSGVVAAFDGRLDNRDELLSALPDATTRDPDVALVAEAYVAWGDRFPQRLNGEYALAVLDAHLAEVCCSPATSLGLGSGVQPDPGRRCVVRLRGESPVRRPSVPSDPNLDVMAEYLLGGNARATPWDSFFAGVRRVPPGVTVLVDDAGITWRTHDAFDREEGRSIEYGVVRRGVPAAIHRSCDATSPERHPVGLFVSGGLDSSSILAVALTQGGGPGPSRSTSPSRRDPGR